MAKFILTKVTLSDGNNYDADQGDITNVIVEASLPTIEPNTVVVDDGQTINESYNVSIEMRTKSTNLSGSQSGAILSSAHVSFLAAQKRESLTQRNSFVASPIDHDAHQADKARVRLQSTASARKRDPRVRFPSSQVIV